MILVYRIHSKDVSDSPSEGVLASQPPTALNTTVWLAHCSVLVLVGKEDCY